MSDLAGTASEALLELLDDVLDLSKLEARHLTLAKVLNDLSQLARSVFNIAALQARAKKLDIDLQTDLPPDTNLLLELPDSSQSDVECGEVHGTRPGYGRPFSRIRAGDIGVPPERQQDLFRAYHQAHRTSRRRFGSTGLGLAICHELCELMGVEIRFDSPAGVGNTVICHIPVESTPAACNNAARVTAHSGGRGSPW